MSNVVTARKRNSRSSIHDAQSMIVGVQQSIRRLSHQHNQCRLSMRKEVAIVLVTRNVRIAVPKDVRKELQIIDVDKLKGELVAQHDKTSIVLTRI